MTAPVAVQPSRSTVPLAMSAARAERLGPVGDREEGRGTDLEDGAGQSDAEIAQALFLSPTTVRDVVSAVFAELQAADRSEAASRAREAGVTPR